MKKTAILMVVLLLAIALTACTQQEAVPDEEQDTAGDGTDAEIEETLEQQTVSEDEEVEVGNMT